MVQVYDVSPFLEDHPGGDEVLLAATGKISIWQFTCQSFTLYIFRAFCVALTDAVHDIA